MADATSLTNAAGIAIALVSIAYAAAFSLRTLCCRSVVMRARRAARTR